jgi:hypothetical protein
MMCCSPVDSRITAVGITDERNTFSVHRTSPAADCTHTVVRKPSVGWLISCLLEREHDATTITVGLRQSTTPPAGGFRTMV